MLLPRNNGQPFDPFSSGATLKARPTLVVGIGTAATTQLRYFQQRLLSGGGSSPPQVRVVGIDCTSQPPLPIPPLMRSAFINLAEGNRQLQARLRASLKNAHYAQWMPQEVVRAAVGDGAGAMPSVGRFYLEQALPELEKRLLSAIGPFLPLHRGDLASRASRHALLRNQDATMADHGPIDVFFLVSTTGGTVGIFLYVLILLRALLRKHGIEAHFRLVLTLPAIGSSGAVDQGRMHRLCWGRLCELLDSQCGRTFTWHLADGRVMTDRGPFWDTVLTLPEPVMGDLLGHHRRVGTLLYHFVSPRLGNVLKQSLVDMLGQFSETGPLGQPKFLTACGFSELKAAAYDHPARFAAAFLGMAVTDSPQPTSLAARTLAEDVLARHGWTMDAIGSLLPRLDRPTAAPAVAAGKVSALVNVERTRRKAAAEKLAAQAKQRLSEMFQRFRDDVLDHPSGKLATQATAAGLTAGLDLARELCAGIERLRLALQDRLGQPTPQTPSVENASPLTQLIRVTEEVERASYPVVWTAALKHLEALVRAIESLLSRGQAAAESLRMLHKVFAAAAQPFEPRFAAPQAILDRDDLLLAVQEALPACQQEVRAAIGDAVAKGTDVERLQHDVRAIVERCAAPLARLGDVEEALRLAGPEGERAVENAMSAAEPAVRPDELYELDRVAARRLYVSIPEKHPIASLVMRRERAVTFVPPIATESKIVFVALDIGLEVGALAAAREAAEAILERSSSMFPPFADKRFEPQLDLLVPPRSEWYGQVAFALNWFLGTGAASERHGRLYFRDVPLGDSYPDAVEALLSGADRETGLPTLLELCDLARSTLLATGRAGEVLAELEKSLTCEIDELRDASGVRNPKWMQVKLRERAAVRGLRRALGGEERDAQVLRGSFGRGAAFLNGRPQSSEANGNGSSNGQSR